VEYFGESLLSLGFEREELVVLDSDVSASTKTSYFAERFPDRFIQVGISEQDMVGVAAGLAASGKIPVVCGFAIFVTGRAWEQVANSVARPGLNVKLVGTHGGLSPSADGSSHQALSDIALMRTLPKMKVVIPADASGASAALNELVNLSGPSYLRLGRGAFPVIYEDGSDFTIGESIVISNGIMVSRALEAAEELMRGGIDATVIDMHTVKPLDHSKVKKVAEDTGALVTVEEHSIIGGLGSAVAETVSEILPTPVVRVGVRDQFGESSRSYITLLEKYGLSAQAIKEAVYSAIKIKN
jgi:transketolase